MKRVLITMANSECSGEPVTLDGLTRALAVHKQNLSNLEEALDIKQFLWPY